MTRLDTNPGKWTVFTKPWRDLPLPALAAQVSDLGFDGVELPVRPGFQVEPERAATDLHKAASVFADQGLRIGSVAGEPTTTLIDACGVSAVPIIRVCIEIPRDRSYREKETAVRHWLDNLLRPLAAAGVMIGIQNHYGDNVANAMGVRHIVEGYDPALVGAVWDGAHCGLDGETPRLAADILWSHLCLVNLKNARWERVGTDRFGASQWQARFVPGRDGLCSWPEVLGEAARRGYRGDMCLTAEYSDHEQTLQSVRADLAWARSLVAELAARS